VCSSDLANIINKITDGKALIIAVSEYSKMRPLLFCKEDGMDMNSLVIELGYKADNLIGDVRYDNCRKSIIEFFTHAEPDDLLLFYYSGHGIPDSDNQLYLATTTIDPENPVIDGIDFGMVARLIYKCKSSRIVVILDCCYSGGAELGKGYEDLTVLGEGAINNASKIIQQGIGKCILASSQSTEESFKTIEENKSLFTFYIHGGLIGNENSVDSEGNVTVDTLSKFVHYSIINLPPEKKPKQTPIRKIEGAGEIVLASFKNLSKPKIEDLLRLLKNEKVEDFNRLREQSRYTYVNFNNQDLSKMTIKGANLAGADLRGANLSESDLSESDLRMARLSRANLSECRLNRAKMDQVDLTDSDLTGADLGGAILREATLSGAIMRLTSLQNANLSKSDLRGAILSQADLTRADLRDANLFNAELIRAKLNEADLGGARFKSANLEDADLKAADIAGADFRNALLPKTISKEYIKNLGGIV